jgi:hypothetical protein
MGCLTRLVTMQKLRKKDVYIECIQVPGIALGQAKETRNIITHDETHKVTAAMLQSQCKTSPKRGSSTYLTRRAVWNISSSCLARRAGSVGGGSDHCFFSLILRIFSAMYFKAWSKNKALGIDNDKHLRCGYGKGSRARRLVQAEETIAVLLKTYRDTGDPGRRTYRGLGLGSPDLDVCFRRCQIHTKGSTLLIPYNGLRSR